MPKHKDTEPQRGKENRVLNHEFRELGKDREFLTGLTGWTGLKGILMQAAPKDPLARLVEGLGRKRTQRNW